MERDSIEELLQHRSWVRSLARSLVRNPAEADDLEQEGWLAAVQRPPDQPVAFRGWMRRVLKNRLANRRQREAARLRRERAAARPEPTEDLLDQLEMQKGMAEAVGELAEPYRTVVLLRYFEELPPRKIAARLGIPVETVRTRNKRALAMMRGKLKRKYPDWRAGLILLAWPPGGASAALGVIAVSKTQKLAVAAVVVLLLGGALFFEFRSGRSVPERGNPRERSSADTTLVAGADDTQVASLPATWAVQGRTMNGKEKPLADVRIEARVFAGYEARGAPLHTETLVSDATGNFEWSLDSPEQTVTLQFSATAPQSMPARQSILVVAGGDPPRVTLTLRAVSAVVEGTVTDGEGRPLRDVRITRGRNLGKTVTDSAGRFVLRVTDSPQTMLYALADGFAVKRAIVNLTDGAGTVSFQLRPEFRITGRIVDRDGAPVHGAVVRTFFTMYSNEARTDADGRYSLGHLDPGRPSHMLRATHAGYLDGSANVTTAGKQVEQDLVLDRGVAVHGRIAGDADARLAGWRISLGDDPNSVAVRHAVSRDDGSFAFKVVAPGEANIYFFPKGHAPVIRKVRVPEDFPLTIELEPGHTLAGTVAFKGGRVAAGVMVTAKAQDTYLRQRSETDAKGRWNLSDLPAGKVQLEVFGSGMVRHESDAMAVGRKDVALTVQEAVRFRGRVVDAESGEPVEAFTIRFKRVYPPGGGLSATWVREGHRFADSKGYWDSGKYTEFPKGTKAAIEARADGYSPGSAQLEAGADADKGVIRLNRGYTLRVVVTTVDGTPVAGAQVEIVRSEGIAYYGESTHGKRVTRTGTDGAAVLLNLTEREATVAVTHPSFAPHQQTVPGGGTAPLRVRLIKGGTLHGRAKAGELVELVGRDKTRTVTASAAGLFRFTALPPGDYSLCRRLSVKSGAMTRYYRPIARPIVLGMNETLERDLEAGGRAVLRGATDLPDGTIVMLMNPKQVAAPSTRVLDGRYELTGLEAGEYTLIAHATGRHVRESIALEAAQTKSADLYDSKK